MRCSSCVPSACPTACRCRRRSRWSAASCSPSLPSRCWPGRPDALAAEGAAEAQHRQAGTHAPSRGLLPALKRGSSEASRPRLTMLGGAYAVPVLGLVHPDPRFRTDSGRALQSARSCSASRSASSG